MKCLVAGAGGFIGGHLVKRLRREGHTVFAVDLKRCSIWWQRTPSWWQKTSHYSEPNWDEDRGQYDLRLREVCMEACKGAEWIFNLAADMGGIGFIESNKAACMLSVLINTHLLMAAREARVKRYFYASSACVYHAKLQDLPYGQPLLEQDAYYKGGAMPEDGYGWEKLFSERMCRHFTEDFGLETRVARFHNIYGPHGSWNDGREKAPAAICRKVAEAKLREEKSIEVWGDGTIIRSFCFIDDCIDGIMKLMQSDYSSPLNIGSDELVEVSQLVGAVEDAAGYVVDRDYDTTKPQGVMGRNSDNTLCQEVLSWQPETPLSVGIEKAYDWVERQVQNT